jgi:methylated-DNA-[protein]-cysteine S-methyltransferase
MKDKIDFGYIKFGQCIIKIEVSGNKLITLTFTDSIKEQSHNPEVQKILKQMEEYFAGKRKIFEVVIDPSGTEFQKLVWKALQSIPYGETRTYKDVAIMIGRPFAYRAVGLANHNNPISIIIPCHRVIGSDGKLTGYAGGLEIKKELLELEKRHNK